MASLKNTTINDTGHLTLPVGTNAQRPTPSNGMIRYNTDIGQMEAYVNGAWVTISTGYTIEMVLVAGGGAGGGGSNGGGGGGGGGVIINSGILVSAGTGYSIVIGGGGASVSGSGSYGSQGGNSTAFGFTALGGGGGVPNGYFGIWNSVSNGGSGGGGGRDTASYDAFTFGLGTTGQGNNGAGAFKGGYASAGGGGGAGNCGYTGGDDLNGRYDPISCGGEGALINWTGTNYYYGPGGGGAFENAYGNANGPAPGGRGLGDGGGYGATNSVGPTSGTANRGAGGGGTKNTSSGAGGSGRCIIRYAGPQRGSGGTITSYGGYTVHTFDASGTFTA